MNNINQRYKTAMSIFEQFLETFRFPTPMSTFNKEEIRNIARLVWAMQILLKDVIAQLDNIGDSAVLMERLERMERMIICSKGVLTANEVCEMLGVAKSQLYNLVKKHDLPTLKISGKMMFFKVEDVVDWSMTHSRSRSPRPIEMTGLIKGDYYE